MKASVLMIDDDPSHLKLYSWILERAEVDVTTVLVGGTSVTLPDPQAVMVDLVILDYRLRSTLTASDVAEMVKEKYPDAPILVLSELPFMPEAAREYADAFVTKGEPAELVRMVGELAGARRKAS